MLPDVRDQFDAGLNGHDRLICLLAVGTMRLALPIWPEQAAKGDA